MLAGTNLQELLIPVARTSFNYALIEAGIGMVSGLVLGALLFHSKHS
jgi:hypothetical protein